MTPGENALNQISRAQAFAHEHLNHNDLALQLYEGACARGDGVSCATAGKNLRDGLGIEKNPKRARILLKIGCEFEDWRACRDLGKLVKWGVGGPQNPDEANNFFKKARRLRGQK